MKLDEGFKQSFFNLSITKAVAALKDFENALNDQARMCEAENEIMMLASWEFVRAFNSVARLICSARIAPFADTYCSLAKKAVEMLAKGEEEKDVLYYFDKLYVKEMAGETE